jgi:hypothetical protein
MSFFGNQCRKYFYGTRLPGARRPNACWSMGYALSEGTPYARCQVVRLRLWSPSTTRVRSQLFLSYASSTGPIGPTRVVVGFRRGGRDLFCGALCLRVRLTRVVRVVVRVSYGACRPHACRCGIPQRRERPLLGCALPEARRPHARC